MSPIHSGNILSVFTIILHYTIFYTFNIHIYSIVVCSFRTTIRATLILLPLFGIQFIMMSQRPVNATCYWDSVFYFASYSIDSSQGVVVSLFYCYLNKEVSKHLALRAKSILQRVFCK